ncbi:hypothetical protein GCM10010231_24520 [Streptomyces sindenensis]|nr:hypothetical protein GCM10010231_24520 [Streptomyces sindenensis]
MAGEAVEDAPEGEAETGGPTGAAGAAGASAAICRSGMAGRRATVSGGASPIRSGRTAAGRDGTRTAASALLPGPSVGRPGAGRAPAESTEPTEPDGPDGPTGWTEPDGPTGSDEPDEPPGPTAADERDEPDGPDRGEELDEVADPVADEGAGPDPAAFAGPDTGPDRAAFELPDASPEGAESAGPAERAVPNVAVDPVEAAERDTYTVPGVPADDDRAAGPEAPDDDGFPDPGSAGPGAPDAPGPAAEAPVDDRDAAPGAREDDRLPGPAAPDDDRSAPEAADRWTGGDAGPDFPDPGPAAVPRADVLPAEADGRSEAAPGDSAGSSVPTGRTARSSSGPPGDAAEGRAEPGRATPWMRPTGADGRTAWPSSPPRDGFCQEARRERNRRPSLTLIDDRATVTGGGATRRHPPSQPPPSAPPPPASPDTVAPAGPVGTADTSSRPPPPRVPLSRDGVTDRRRSVRRSQSPNPTRSPAFVDAGVDPRYLPHPLLTFAVGEVENVLTLPVEVVGDVRDLLPQPGKRVRHDSPRRPPERSTSNEPWHSGQVTAACVWPSLLIRR